MTIMMIHNHGMRSPEIVQALKSQNSPYMEVNGLQDAYDLLIKKSSEFHTIITCYNHLSDDGEFLKKLAENHKLKDIPLILNIPAIDPPNIKDFTHSASCQWLFNPFTEPSLHLMVHAAENDYTQRRTLRQKINSQQSVIETMTRAVFHIKTIEQAKILTDMLSQTCPDPDRIAFGLFEMLTNSIEHGNLEIGNEEKWRLMANNCHRDEINMRLDMPEYKDRYVEITFEREKALVSFKIEDQGSGFNFKDYLNIDFSANQTPHGRGISLARATSFDYMEFLGKGNKLLAITKFATE